MLAWLLCEAYCIVSLPFTWYLGANGMTAHLMPSSSGLCSFLFAFTWYCRTIVMIVRPMPEPDDLHGSCHVPVHVHSCLLSLDTLGPLEWLFILCRDFMDSGMKPAFRETGTNFDEIGRKFQVKSAGVMQWGGHAIFICRQIILAPHEFVFTIKIFYFF